MLKVENLKKYFGGVKAVNGASFQIKKNKITALIGPNGSGKTTIFNLISGLERPDFGRIIFDNKDITKLSIEKISNMGISRIFQHSRLFENLLVKENLEVAMNNKDTQFWSNLLGLNYNSNEFKIKEILESLDMSAFFNTCASELSYGQKRLIELGRAILDYHKLIMLDEPVAGINPGLRKKLSKIILDLKEKGETILLIEHDMEFTLGIADEVIVLDEGVIIAQGSPNEIRNNPKVLEAYLGD